MAKNDRSFRYQERTKDEMRQRANQQGGDFDSWIKREFKTYKVKDGKNIIRVLPPTWDKPRHYGYDVHVNYSIGPDNNSYLSLSKMLNKADPLLEARLLAEKEGDEDLAKKLRPTKRVLMWVIDRQNESDGPLLWAAPWTVDKAFANLATDEDTGSVVFIDDPQKGCDVRFYKEGSQLTTKYDASKMKLMPAGPLSDDEEKAEDWLQFITENPVPECLHYYDAAYIAKVYGGGAAKSEEDDDVSPPNKAHGSEDTPRARPRPRVVDEDDEPAPKSRRSIQAVSNEDDDETPRESIRDRIKRRREAAEAQED